MSGTTTLGYGTNSLSVIDRNKSPSYYGRPRTRNEFHENSLVKLRRGSDASWRGSLQDLRRKITSWKQ